MSYEQEYETELITKVDDAGVLAELTRAEVDVQIATAKKYPRSVARFARDVVDLACLDEEIAGDCIYALPRGGKHIEGPSARLAEIVAHSWGNCKAGARVISEDDKFVVAQGVFHDLEKNVAITYEVKRRITDKYDKRFNADMIAVTANAACSIALRNAVFKGVPKSFWKKAYDEARRTAVGTAETLVNKRSKMVSAFGLMGVTEAMICSKMEVGGIEDIGLEKLGTLRGMYTALKEGDSTIEQMFSVSDQPGSKVKESDLNDAVDSLAGDSVEKKPKQSGKKQAKEPSVEESPMQGAAESSSDYKNRIIRIAKSCDDAEKLKSLGTHISASYDAGTLTDEDAMEIQTFCADKLQQLTA